MSWLAAMFVARSVDVSLARQTADLQGRPPKSLAGICGWVVGTVFLVGSGLVCALLGIDNVPVFVALMFLFAAVVVGCWTSATVNQLLRS